MICQKSKKKKINRYQKVKTKKKKLCVFHLMIEITRKKITENNQQMNSICNTYTLYKSMIWFVWCVDRMLSKGIFSQFHQHQQNSFFFCSKFRSRSKSSQLSKNSLILFGISRKLVCVWENVFKKLFFFRRLLLFIYSFNLFYFVALNSNWLIYYFFFLLFTIELFHHVSVCELFASTVYLYLMRKKCRVVEITVLFFFFFVCVASFGVVVIA